MVAEDDDIADFASCGQGVAEDMEGDPPEAIVDGVDCLADAADDGLDCAESVEHEDMCTEEAWDELDVCFGNMWDELNVCDDIIENDPEAVEWSDDFDDAVDAECDWSTVFPE